MPEEDDEKTRYDRAAKKIVQLVPFLKEVLRKFVKEVKDYSDEELVDLIHHSKSVNCHILYLNKEKFVDVTRLFHTKAGPVIVHIENQLGYREKNLQYRNATYNAGISLRYHMEHPNENVSIYNFWYIFKPLANLEGQCFCDTDKDLKNNNGKSIDAIEKWTGEYTAIIGLYNVAKPDRLDQLMACQEDYLAILSIIFADYLSLEEKKSKLKLRGVQLSKNDEKEVENMEGVYEGIRDHFLSTGRAEGRAETRAYNLALTRLIAQGRSNEEIMKELTGAKLEDIEAFRDSMTKK